MDKVLLKKMNRQNKTHRIQRWVVIRREGAWGWVKWVKGVNCITTGGNQTSYGGHLVV